MAVSDFLFREDLYSLGYVFLELVFGAFCDVKSKRPDQNSLKRLLEDIFKGDFKAFKVRRGGRWRGAGGGDFPTFLSAPKVSTKNLVFRFKLESFKKLRVVPGSLSKVWSCESPYHI